MQSLFLDTRVLDATARERYGLTEELMMENAAAALERVVVSQIAERAAQAKATAEQHVVILCGGGNNGADGYALSRRLQGTCFSAAVPVVSCVIAASAPKTDLCRAQAERAQKCGVACFALSREGEPQAAVQELKTILSRSTVIVDCLFGSGFHGELSEPDAALCAYARTTAAVRIACDVPTGVREDGTVSDGAFCADVTVTMGALKQSLYSDAAKDVVGKVVCENLGVSRALFEQDMPVSAMLLQTDDLQLPERKKNLVNKGSFGHVAIASGEKIGASCIAGEAALHFGAGLVTLVRLGVPFEKAALPQVTPELMTTSDFPANTTAVAVGMGLGRTDAAIQPYFDWLITHADIPCVLDADACYCSGIAAFLQTRAQGVVLTPHPKEFQFLLHTVGLGNYTIADCVHQRSELIGQFCRAFPGCVLLVKGANPVIGTLPALHALADTDKVQLFINPLGTPALAKAGSGDVLAGLIAALLAQGYAPLSAAVNGSLAHALASRQGKNAYSLTPLSLISAVAALDSRRVPQNDCGRQ